MGWVDSPKFFCSFLETLEDVANALVDTELPIPAYVAIEKISTIGTPPPIHTHTRVSPILDVIWMMSSLRCRVGQNVNAKSLMEKFMPSSGSSH